jgi:thiol-disulfide isomerase/thioredoxin
MKKSITMFVLSLVTGIAFGQAIVTVNVTPLKVDTLGIIEDHHYTDITPSKNGNFVFRFNEGLPKWVTIESYKRERFFLYIEKGDNLNIVTNLDRKMPVFSGKGAANAETAYQIYNSLKDSWDAIDDSTVKTGTANDLNNSFERMFQKGFHLLEENKKRVTPAFYKNQFSTLYYQSLGFKLDVPFWYMHMTGLKLSVSIPDHYWDLAKLIKCNDKLLENEAYTDCMFSSVPQYYTWQYQFKNGAPDSTFDLFIHQYRCVEKEYSGKTRSSALRVSISSRIRSLKDATVLKPLLDEYLQKYAAQEKPEDIHSLQEVYHTATNLSVGQTPPPFVLKDINGKDVTLNDFTGKVIYMDFWASWCGPCREQMKSAPKLHKLFEGNKEIVFLYINMDEKIDLGKKAIEEDKIEGIQLFSGGFQKGNAIVKAFNISGIPRYLIIGKDGKILDNNAPRPNEDITLKYLNDALKAR